MTKTHADVVKKNMVKKTFPFCALLFFCPISAYGEKHEKLLGKDHVMQRQEVSSFWGNYIAPLPKKGLKFLGTHPYLSGVISIGALIIICVIIEGVMLRKKRRKNLNEAEKKPEPSVGDFLQSKTRHTHTQANNTKTVYKKSYQSLGKERRSASLPNIRNI